MNKQLLQRIEELFAQKLQAKTGWVLAAYKDAVREALMEAL